MAVPAVELALKSASRTMCLSRSPKIEGRLHPLSLLLGGFASQKYGAKEITEGSGPESDGLVGS